MKRYRVIFEDSAQADVRESYDWGCRAWGKREHGVATAGVITLHFARLVM